MRLWLALFFFATAACDSSSGSKSTPVSPETVPETAPATSPESGGDDAVAGTTPLDGGSSPDAPPVEEPSGGDNPEPLDPTALKFGLTTTRVELLRRLGDDLAVRAKDFRAAAEALRDTTAGYCASPSAESLAAAQDSWRAVMNIWQYFEVFQIGPVVDNAKVLKFNIYAWPDPANYCKIDEEALKSTKSTAYKLPPNNNRKGLQAVEYALFEETLQSRCNAGTAVAQQWNALDTSGKTAARCSYLKFLTTEIALQGANLESRWGVPGNSYLTPILGDPAKVNQAIQALYEAAYYVDLEVKNQKMAGPAGIDTRYCSNAPEPCLEKAEFAFSGFSRQAINVNLEAFADMLFGSAASGRAGGLSALVRAEGASGLASADRTETLASNLAAIAKDDADSSLDQLIEKFAKENCDSSAATWICKTRNSIRQIFSDLKGEYAEVLKVKAPAAAAGDND